MMAPKNFPNLAEIFEHFADVRFLEVRGNVLDEEVGPVGGAVRVLLFLEQLYLALLAHNLDLIHSLESRPRRLLRLEMNVPVAL